MTLTCKKQFGVVLYVVMLLLMNNVNDNYFLLYLTPDDHDDHASNRGNRRTLSIVTESSDKRKHAKLWKGMILNVYELL